MEGGNYTQYVTVYPQAGISSPYNPTYPTLPPGERVTYTSPHTTPQHIPAPPKSVYHYQDMEANSTGTSNYYSHGKEPVQTSVIVGVNEKGLLMSPPSKPIAQYLTETREFDRKNSCRYCLMFTLIVVFLLGMYMVSNYMLAQTLYVKYVEPHLRNKDRPPN